MVDMVQIKEINSVIEELKQDAGNIEKISELCLK